MIFLCSVFGIIVPAKWILKWRGHRTLKSKSLRKRKVQEKIFISRRSRLAKTVTF